MSAESRGIFSRIKFSNIKMKPKMIGLLLLVGLAPLAIGGWLSTRAAETALMKKSFDQLESLREVKKAQVQFYFQTMHDQMEVLAENQMFIDAVRKFTDEFKTFREENQIDDARLGQLREELKTYYTGEFTEQYKSVNGGAKPDVESVLARLDAESIALQYYYVRANKNPLGSKHQLDRADDASRWSTTHAVIHPILRNFVAKFGLYDLFLADADTGDIVYTNFKELDFTTNMIDGPYSRTSIAEAFRQATALDGPGAVMVDYARYFPSYEAPASFMAAPVFDGEKKIGVLMIQMPIDRLNKIMQERAGLGETGETYLIGSDKLMRSDSFLEPEHHTVVASFADPDKGDVDTESAKAALAGDSENRIVDDYNGNPVLSSFAPIEVVGQKWALLAEIDLKEIRQPIRALITQTLIVSGVIAVLVAIIALVVALGIASPLIKGVNLAKAVADGDLTQQAAINQEDEIGILAKALNAMSVNLREIVRNVVSKSATLSAASEEMSATSKQMTENAENVSRQSTSAAAATEQASANIKSVAAATEQVSANSNSVAIASQQVSDNLNSVGAATEEMSANMNSIASAVEEMSSSVNTVASAVEEMSSSLSEVSSNTKQATEVAELASRKANDTAQTVDRLGIAAKEIDKVVGLITGIADQTNLLALNATIEAASAGDAGKGFAVVANEVKELAKQTARATEDIRRQVEGMQGTTKEAVSAIGEIVSVIAKVTDAFRLISAAVVEQTRAVNEISHSVGDAAKGASEVSHNVQEAAKGVSDVSQNVQQAIGRVNEITRNMGELATGANEIANNAGQAAQGMTEVAKNVVAVNDSAAQTKGGAEQLNIAARELATMAGELHELMGRFTV